MKQDSGYLEGIEEFGQVDVVPPSVFQHNSMVAAEMYHPGRTQKINMSKNLLDQVRLREKSNQSVRRSGSRSALKKTSSKASGVQLPMTSKSKDKKTTTVNQHRKMAKTLLPQQL